VRSTDTRGSPLRLRLKYRLLHRLLPCLLLAACVQRPPLALLPDRFPVAAPPPATLSAAPAASADPSSKPSGLAPDPASTAAAAPAPGSAPAVRAPRYVKLAAPPAPRDAQALRLQFAQRLVAAHPDTSYLTPAPDRLLAIPVIETELNADGSVRRIEVLRRPSTGDESIPLAIQAIRRAAPYGDVSRLPRPWRVVETFLFDDTLRFKPRTLD
jgi:hypothetical protein